MTSHINPLRRMSPSQRRDIEEFVRGEMDNRRKEIQNETTQKVFIASIYLVWQTYHIGEKRIWDYINALDAWARKAADDDTWIEETVAALHKIGVNLEIENEGGTKNV